jgi:hypothetical protein
VFIQVVLTADPDRVVPWSRPLYTHLALLARGNLYFTRMLFFYDPVTSSKCFICGGDMP